MTTMSSVTVAENLTRDRAIRYTRDGQAHSSLSLAVTRRWQNRDTQEWEEATPFFDVSCWRELAENVVLSLTKGARVVVTGHLEQHSWETEAGDRRTKVDILADDIGASLCFATAEVQRAQHQDGAREPADEVAST
jgi:single-strand DNA-binding protein